MWVGLKAVGGRATRAGSAGGDGVEVDAGEFGSGGRAKCGLAGPDGRTPKQPGEVVARALEVEAERRAVLVLLVNDDESGRFAGTRRKLRRDGGGELRGAEHRSEDLQAKVRGEQEAEGPGGGDQICSMDVVTNASPFESPLPEADKYEDW